MHNRPRAEPKRPAAIAYAFQSRRSALQVAGLATLLIAADALPSVAQQVAPSRVTPESLRPAPAPPPSIELPNAAPAAAPANAANLSVEVGRFAVDGTFPGFEGQTAAVLDPLRGKRLTVAQIYEAAAALEQAYAAAGYVLARVVVPAQKLVDGGAVRLVVVDAVVERVDVGAVPERLRDIVAARMAAVVGEPHLKLEEIERRLLLVSDLPGLQLRSTLAAGATAGGTLLVVEATQNYATGSVGIDNRLPNSLGTWAVNTNLTINDAFGFGEQAYFSYSSSPDLGEPRLRVRGGGIVLPVGDDGFTINPEYTESVSRAIPVAGTPASLGDFQRFALHAAYPLIRTREQTLTLLGTGEWDDEKLSAIEFGTLLYHDIYGVGRFGAHDVLILPWGATLDIDGLYAHGLAGRGGSAAVPLSQQGARPVFNKLNAHAALHQSLPGGFAADLTARAQTSFGSALMVAEQFSLDSPDALSSFAAGTLNVDEGATLRMELSRPFSLPLGPMPALDLSPYLFGAFGRGVIDQATAAQKSVINAGSAGIGIRNTAMWLSTVPLGTSLAVEFGRQFSNVPGQRDGYRTNVALNVTF